MWDWIAKITRNQTGLYKLAPWVLLLPRPLIRFIIWTGGLIIYHAGSRTRRQIQKNMAEILTNTTHKTIRKYARNYFHTLVYTIYEILFESGILHRIKDWKFHCIGEEHLEKALRLGRGAILFAPHMGNFFFYYWYLSKKYPCLTVASGGSQILRPFYQQFQALGCQGLDYDNTHPLELMRLLRKHLNNNGVVLLLGDFWRPNFPEATLFGHTTKSPIGTAALALDLRVPVLPFYGWHDHGFHHQMVLAKPVFLYMMYGRQQRAEAVEALNRILENMIRKVPGQWFYWFNIHEHLKADSKGTSNTLHY